MERSEGGLEASAEEGVGHDGDSRMVGEPRPGEGLLEEGEVGGGDEMEGMVREEEDSRGNDNVDRKSRKRFTVSMDVLLLGEISAREPFAAPHGKVNETWEEVTSALNASGSFPWEVDMRMARDRFGILERWLKRADGEILRRGGTKDLELREHLLNDVVSRKDSMSMIKEEKRADRGTKKAPEPLSLSLAVSTDEWKREYGGGGYTVDSKAKRARESHSIEDVLAHLKEKDQSWREAEQKRLELAELRIQADISDLRKERELEDIRLSLERENLTRTSEERKLLHQILDAIQAKKRQR